MSDPFRPQVNNQLIREARIGLTILALLIGVLVYVAYFRITGQSMMVPEHVLEAPAALTVWPGEPPPLASMTNPDVPPANPTNNNVSTANRNRQNRKAIITSQAVPSQNQNLIVSPTPRTSLTEKSQSARRERGSWLNNLFSGSTIEDSKSITPLPSDQTAVVVASPPQDPFVEPVVESSTGELPALDMNTLRATSLPPLAKDKFVRPASAQSPINNLNPAESDGAFKIAPPVVTQLTSVNPQLSPTVPISAVGTESDTLEFKPLPLRPAKSDEFNLPEGQTANRVSHAPPRALQHDLEPVTEEFVSDNKTMATKNKSTDLNAVTAKQPTTTQTGLTESTNQKPYHRVQSGESYWSICQAIYGDGRVFRALFKHNESRVGDFANLEAGMTLETPTIEELCAEWPDDCPADLIAKYSAKQQSNIYITKAGDTLFDISRQQLDQASRYVELIRLNQNTLHAEINHMTPLPTGLRLQLPVQ